MSQENPAITMLNAITGRAVSHAKLTATPLLAPSLHQLLLRGVMAGLLLMAVERFITRNSADTRYSFCFMALGQLLTCLLLNLAFYKSSQAEPRLGRRAQVTTSDCAQDRVIATFWVGYVLIILRSLGALNGGQGFICSAQTVRRKVQVRAVVAEQAHRLGLTPPQVPGVCLLRVVL